MVDPKGDDFALCRRHRADAEQVGTARMSAVEHEEQLTAGRSSCAQLGSTRCC
jgi:hypothetical protein